MAEQTDKTELPKAWAFFEKARKAAEAGSFDYAVDMYIDGLRFAPEAVQDGHIKLRNLALQRQDKGGKKLSMMDKIKLSRGHTPLDQMLSAELMFSKDPANIAYGERMLKAAIEGGYKQTAKWIADLLFQINNSSQKPSVKTYVLLKDSYMAINEFERAIVACQMAVRLKPQDADLADDFKRLSAELTMVRGKYDQGSDFRTGIKDREIQEKMQSQESVIKTEDYRITAIKEAREALAADPDLPKNIYALAQTLSDMEDEASENEAIQVLEKAYEKKQDFSFKERAGQIRIKQLNRKAREAKIELESKPNDAQAAAVYETLSKQLNETKLEHYRLCVENYPTDLAVKFEYGNCLLQNKRFDEAIPLFQEAQRDPRHKISALGKIGLCFFYKGWYQDAIDVFNQAIDAYEIKDDSTAKELRYNLGRAFEANKETEKALDVYRRIAQLDFGYRDVRQRVDALRSGKK